MNSTLQPWRSLKTKTTLGALSIFLVGIWSLSYYASQILRQDMESLLGEQQFSTVSLVAAQIDRELAIRLDALEKVSQLSAGAIQAGPAAMQALIEQRPTLQTLFNGGVYVTGLDGTVIADTPLPVERVGVNYMDRDYIVGPLQNGKSVIGRPVIGKSASAPVFVMTVAIRDAMGKVVGVLAGVTGLDRPNFLDGITEGRYGKTGGYLLVAPQYRLVVSATDKSRVMETLPAPGINPLIDRFIEGYEESGVVVNPHGVEVLASAKGIPVAGWYMTAVLPTSEAFMPIHDMRQRMSFAALLLSFLTAGLIWWMLRRQLSPLLMTAKALADMSDGGQVMRPLVISGRDEIGYLIRAFNRLIDALGQRETALRESEERFRALHDASFGGIAIHEKGIILDCNQSLSELTGFAAEELIGMDGLNLIAPEYRGEVMQKITHGFEDSYDVEGLRKDGTHYPLSIQGKNIPYKGRSVRVTEFRDITERKRALEELRFSEENLAITLHSIGDAVIATDATGRVTRMNPTAERLTGWALADACNHLLPEVFHIINAETREIVTNPVQLVMEHGQVVGLANHTVLLSRNGQEFQIADSAAPICDSSGVIVGVVLVFSDVTEQYRMEQALRENDHILQESQRVARIGSYSTNVIAQTWTVSKGMYAVLGIDESYPLTLDSWRELIHPDCRDELVEYYLRLLAEKTRFDYAYKIIRNNDGAERWVQGIGELEYDDQNNPVLMVGTIQDITEHKLAEEKVNHLAYHDQLTDLPNRRLLIDRLERALLSRSRHHREGAVLLVDLDNFKTINDTLGHEIGDLLLLQVSQRLVSCVREGDVVARLGGDEFVIMLENLSEKIEEAAAQAQSVGEKILTALNQTYQIANYTHHSTASIGVTLFSDGQGLVEELLKQADLAMYQAKGFGRNTLLFFNKQMQAVVTARATLENDLREAILEGQFLIYYQPQVDSSGQTIGAEALIRWQHPMRGFVSPAEFIPLAEETGQILPIGQWVLDTACIQLAAWAARPEFAHFTVAVNVSARQFHHRDFVDQVLDSLKRSNADPHRLKLELTESLLVNDVNAVIAKMTALKANGVRFSLDDFGTGYSSLSYLKRLPLDQLKIDQSFVHDVFDDPNDASIARTIVALGQSLGLAVIAEGVETEAQKDFLANNGCFAYQGYLFSRPLPLGDFEQLVQQFDERAGSEKSKVTTVAF